MSTYDDDQIWTRARRLVDMYVDQGDWSFIEVTDEDRDRAAEMIFPILPALEMSAFARSQRRDRPEPRETATGRKILYHYTSESACQQIIKNGYIDTTDPNYWHARTFIAPEVVWMTGDESDPFDGIGLVNRGLNVRFTVALPADEVSQWGDFATTHGVPTEVVAKALAATPMARDHWVTARPVTVDEWLEVRDRVTGETRDVFTGKVQQ